MIFVNTSRYFQYLSIPDDRIRYDISSAESEAQYCQDLLIQAQYHVVRARRLDEDEKQLRKKQEEECEIIRQQQLKEQVSTNCIYIMKEEEVHVGGAVRKWCGKILRCGVKLT